MRRASTQYYNLLYTAAAMQSSPRDSEALAAHFGVDAILAKCRAPRRSFVYLLDTLTEDKVRYFKIGRSTQPDVRLGQIQSGSGAAMPPMWLPHTSVRPLAIREGGAGIESTIHRELREFRVHGTEWFLGDLAVAQYVVDQDAWDIWDGPALPDDYDFSASTAA